MDQGIPQEPGIDIEKATNGHDADDPNGADVPEIAPGQTVTWTYEVTNTGTEAFSLDEIQVMDNQGGTPELDTASDSDKDSMLSPGETWIYWTEEAAADLSVELDTDDDGESVEVGSELKDRYKDLGLKISALASPTEKEDVKITAVQPEGDDVKELGTVLGITRDEKATDGTIVFDWESPVQVQEIQLLDVTQSGGIVVTLLRDSTAALLNAVDPRVDYSFSEKEVNIA